MGSGAASAAPIEICTPTGTPALTCEVASLATPVAAVISGGAATWDAVFENDQFLQLPGTVTSLTLSLGFDGGAAGDEFFDFFGVAAFYLTDENGDEITTDLIPGGIDNPGALGGVGANGFSQTWTGTGLQNLAIYDFHVSCVDNDCAIAASDLSMVLTGYSFALETDVSNEDLGFTIGQASTAVPAPASLALLGLGLMAIGGWSRRRQTA
jgi:hypothetical protein